MPRGMEGVRQASADVEARRRSGASGGLYFKLSRDEETIVRFLEQDDDIAWCMVHDVPIEGRNWPKQVPCLDQEKEGIPCPGCEQDLPRKFKGFINVIWQDAPVLMRDSENKIVKDSNNKPIVQGKKPQTALWTSGIRLFEDLDEINANFKGLTSRRFKVKRKGEGLDTKYHISPEDIDSGQQPLTDDEKKLAEGKTDLGVLITPGTYEEFLKEMGQAPASVGHGNGQSGGGQTAPRANPFMRNRG